MEHKRSKVWKFELDDFKEMISNSTSYSNVARLMGLSNRVFPNIRERVAYENIDLSHFKGIGGVQRPYTDYFHNNYTKRISGKILKTKLLEGKCKEYKCEMCGIGPEWNNKPLVLQLDHIDGNPLNNQLENLRFVCPICHSQTDTFSVGKTRKENKKIIIESSKKKVVYKKRNCSICKKNELNRRNVTGHCPDCVHKKRRMVERPSYEELLIEIEELGWSGTGRKYGVSDNAIRKWVKTYQKEMV